MKQKNNYSIPFYADKIEAALSAQDAVHAKKDSQPRKPDKKGSRFSAYLMLSAPLFLVGAVALLAPKQTFTALWILALVGLLAVLGSALRNRD